VEAANGHILGLIQEGDEFIVWDGTDRKPILSVPHVRTGLGEIQEAFLSRGGEWLTIVPEDDSMPITIWHLATQSKRAEWPQQLRSRQELVRTSLVSPSGRWLAQSSIDSDVQSPGSAAATILDLRTGNRRNLPALPRDAFALAFSPDESLLTVALEDGVVEVFQVDTGKRLFRWPTGGRLTLPALWFNPNGTELIAKVYDWNSVRILKLDVLRRQLAEMGLDW
jgi:WD40 repeat protein